MTDDAFRPFRETLDARMKELKRTGNYQPKMAEVISVEHENTLCIEKTMLLTMCLLRKNNRMRCLKLQMMKTGAKKKIGVQL